MNEFKLINILKCFIKIAKFQGIFLHRSFKIKTNQVASKTGGSYKIQEIEEFEGFLLENDIHRRTSISKLHFIFCIFVQLILFSSELYGFYLDLLKKSTNEYKADVQNGTFTSTDENYATNIYSLILLKISSLMAPLVSSFIIFYFFLFSSLKTGFYKVLISFEFIENKLLKLYAAFNEKNVLKSERLAYNSKIYLVKFNSIFLLFTTVLLSCYFCFKIFEKENTTFSICLLGLRYTNLLTIVVFVNSNILLINYQANALYRYIDSLVKNKNNEIFNINQIGRHYLDIYKSFKVSAKRIFLFYPLFYLYFIFQIIPYFLISSDNWFILYDIFMFFFIYILPSTIYALLIENQVRLKNFQLFFKAIKLFV